MIFIVNPKLLRKNFDGITIWPFIILRNKSLKENAIFINHERIHLRQQVELLVVFFYLWYAVEFLIRWGSFGNRNLAYRNISFEREAYFHENQLGYLEDRTFWRFLRFL